MPQRLPGPDSYPDVTTEVDLGGSTYRVRWLWNGRSGAWTFCLSDADNSPIVMGVRVLLNTDLLDGVVDARRPAGSLFVVGPPGAADPGFDDLGSTARVVYFTADDAAALS